MTGGESNWNLFFFFFFFYFRFKPDISRETLSFETQLNWLKSCSFVQWEPYILSQLGILKWGGLQFLFLVSLGSKFLLLWTKFSGWKEHIAIPESNSSRCGTRLLSFSKIGWSSSNVHLEAKTRSEAYPRSSNNNTALQVLFEDIEEKYFVLSLYYIK